MLNFTFCLKYSHSVFLSINRLNDSLTLCIRRAHEINPTGVVVSSASLEHRMTDIFLSVMRGGGILSGEEQFLGPHACPSSRGPPGAQILFYWQVIHLISFSLSHSIWLSLALSGLLIVLRYEMALCCALCRAVISELCAGRFFSQKFFKINQCFPIDGKSLLTPLHPTRPSKQPLSSAQRCFGGEFLCLFCQKHTQVIVELESGPCSW